MSLSNIDIWGSSISIHHKDRNYFYNKQMKCIKNKKLSNTVPLVLKMLIYAK